MNVVRANMQAVDMTLGCIGQEEMELDDPLQQHRIRTAEARLLVSWGYADPLMGGRLLSLHLQ